MSVLNQYHQLTPPSPHMPLDVARMGIAGQRSSNLLQWWGDQLCNFSQHGTNPHPQISYDTASLTSQELKLLSILSMGTRNRPYNYTYGFIRVEKPSALTGALELHLAPGIFWPEQNLSRGLILSHELKSGFSSQDFIWSNTLVPEQLSQSKEPYTAWLATRRTNTTTGSIKVLVCGIQWINIA